MTKDHPSVRSGPKSSSSYSLSLISTKFGDQGVLLMDEHLCTTHTLHSFPRSVV